jgi:hypothetical protein
MKKKDHRFIIEIGYIIIIIQAREREGERERLHLIFILKMIFKTYNGELFKKNRF